MNTKTFALISIFSLPALAQTERWNQSMLTASAAEHKGDYRTAAAALHDAVDAAEGAGDARRKLLPAALNGLAIADQNLGRPLDAIPLYQRALKAIDTASGKDSDDYTATLGNLSSAYADVQRLEDAERAARESLSIHARIGSQADASVALSRAVLSQLLMRRGKWAEAEPLVQCSVTFFEQEPAPALHLAAALNNMGVIRNHQGKYDEAIALFRRAVAEVEKQASATHPFLIDPLNNLATVYAAASQIGPAGDCFARAVAIAESQDMTHTAVYANLLTSYGNFLDRTGRRFEAMRLKTRAAEISAGHARSNGAGQVISAQTLSSL